MRCAAVISSCVAGISVVRPRGRRCLRSGSRCPRSGSRRVSGCQLRCQDPRRSFSVIRLGRRQQRRNGRRRGSIVGG